ncbi:MAG: ABC transporter permease [Rhodospirillaceae bacterium]|nr:MAG: ABC transporter permease [Rhodospirillaceae bacterium]
MGFLKEMWPRIVSFLLLLLLWKYGAVVVDSRLLPPPEIVFAVLYDGFQSGEIPHHIGITLGRVAASFVLAMTIGSAIGIAMGRSRLLDRLFDSWLVLFLNIPALVVILLAYVWFGLVESAAILAVAVNKIPNVAVTLREGSRALDRDCLEMARSFRLGSLRTFRHVVLPQLSPYFLASARSGLALIWKIVLVVELLGRSNGVGFQLHLYFQLFDVASILAYTLAFVAVVLVIEAVILRPLDRRAMRWRR